jgi:hypothetical protein
MAAPNVYVLLSLQFAVHSERFITHVAMKWPLSITYPLMSSVDLLNKCLIAHAAAKWPLPTMYALMCVQMTLLTE